MLTVVERNIFLVVEPIRERVVSREENSCAIFIVLFFSHNASTMKLHSKLVFYEITNLVLTEIMHSYFDTTVDYTLLF